MKAKKKKSKRKLRLKEALPKRHLIRMAEMVICLIVVGGAIYMVIHKFVESADLGIIMTRILVLVDEGEA